MTGHDSQTLPTEQPKRKAGRPQKRLVTPEMVERIARLWFQGWTHREIGRAVGGISGATVEYHLDKTIKPMWAAGAALDVQTELAKVAYLERIAWQKFWQSSNPEIRKKIAKRACHSRDKQPVKDELEAAGVPLELIERSVTKITKVGEPAWLEIVKWCCDYRAKIGGLYAAQRHEISTQTDIRVAGMRPEEFDQETFVLLLQRIEERRQYREQIAVADQ